MSDQDAVIAGAVRTPIGRFRGGLSAVRPDDLAGLVIRALTERTRLPADEPRPGPTGMPLLRA